MLRGVIKVQTLMRNVCPLYYLDADKIHQELRNDYYTTVWHK